jgi:hypothetical protein
MWLRYYGSCVAAGETWRQRSFRDVFRPTEQAPACSAFLRSGMFSQVSALFADDARGRIPAEAVLGNEIDGKNRHRAGGTRLITNVLAR